MLKNLGYKNPYNYYGELLLGELFFGWDCVVLLLLLLLFSVHLVFSCFCVGFVFLFVSTSFFAVVIAELHLVRFVAFAACVVIFFLKFLCFWCLFCCSCQISSINKALCP